MRVGGQLHAPAALPPGKWPSTHCIGGWVGPNAGLDGCGKYRPPPGFDPRTVQLVASRYTDYAITVGIIVYNVKWLCLLNRMLYYYNSCAILDPIYYHLVSVFNINSIPFMSFFLWGLPSPHGKFTYCAGVAGRQSQPVENHSVYVCRPKRRTLVKLEQQIRDTFLLTSKGKVLSLSSRLQKCVCVCACKVLRPVLKSDPKWWYMGFKLAQES
jgi:hypothetical protein